MNTLQIWQISDFDWAFACTISSYEHSTNLPISFKTHCELRISENVNWASKHASLSLDRKTIIKLEIVITRAAPAFHKLFIVMGCVFDVNTVHKTVEKLTF